MLPARPAIRAPFDILIVDEVHNCAPAGAGGRYARDTLRTARSARSRRTVEHRLFLSATPHNGYDNSFAALLELLDPHRFARGHQADEGGHARGHGAARSSTISSTKMARPRFTSQAPRSSATPVR